MYVYAITLIAEYTYTSGAPVPAAVRCVWPLSFFYFISATFTLLT